MRKIKLMADYQCYPLWEATEGEIGNIDPSSLPISESLVNDLLLWSKQYDSTLNNLDPLNSGFRSKKDELSFIEFGEKLRERLREELDAEYYIFLFI